MATVKCSELYRWSLVEVEFGTPKKDVFDIECANISRDYPYGINSDNEFSYRHMAIVISKNIKNSTVTVVPLTEAKFEDKDNKSRIVLEQKKYKYFLYKDTSILIDNIMTVEKKKRIKKIKLHWIPKPLRRRIQKAMIETFK